MATVEPGVDLQAWIDDYLDYLIREWGAIPGLAAEWDEWDELSQLDYVIEWPIREDRLHQLQGWSEAGCLTPAQSTRYEELLGLIAKQRPTLERLIAD